MGSSLYINRKSLFIAYLLWLIGGWFGLHHFYLHRDRHAFITWMSLGCYFGMGWFRDLWRLPEYVRDYNEDDDYLEELSSQMKKHKKPDGGSVRSCGTIIIADLLGYLLMGSIPLEYLPKDLNPNYLLATIVPFAVAIGVHTVGNIGRHEGSFRAALIGAYLVSPLLIYSNTSVFWSSLSSLYFFGKTRNWRRKRSPRNSLSKRLTILTLCGLLYLSLISSWVNFNCNITDKDEQVIKCLDATKNFFQSPAWKEFTKTIGDIQIYWKVHGWKGLWKEIVEAIDPQGEGNALQVLNLTNDATQEMITAQYRKLSRQWHPDRYKDEAEKEKAQEQFISIQQAYEVLSRIKNLQFSIKKQLMKRNHQQD